MNKAVTESLDITGLEKVYDDLAQAIDQAGEQRATLFLVKLALLNANFMADATVFQAHIQTALADLASLALAYPPETN